MAEREKSRDRTGDHSGDSDNDGDGGGHPSFMVGLDNSTERLHELQFSLVHHAQGGGAMADPHHRPSKHHSGSTAATPVPPLSAKGSGASEDRMDGGNEAGNPDIRGDSGADLAAREGVEIIAQELASYAAEGHHNLLEEEEAQDSLLFVGSQQEALGVGPDQNPTEMHGMMPIQRMDSREVVFDTRQKRVKILDNYVIGDILGEGAFAKVKEAIDQRTLARRAIKIMKRKKLKRIPKGETNVRNEIMLLSRLRHPNIMSLVDVFYNEEKGKVYLVLEYCCAVLKDMLERSAEGRFPTWQAHFYFMQLLKGLQYIHGQRIVHKDIKPGNLLLNTSGVLKIADFGSAEALELFANDDTSLNSHGTPAFQPPEVARAGGEDRFCGYMVDIWSSGVTLYNFVTGSYPFEGDTIFRLFEEIAKCEYTVPSDVDPLLGSLLRGMLEENPEKRLTLDEVRNHDWCRKKHPSNTQPVTVKPREGETDKTLSTSVIPYLCNLHYGSEVRGRRKQEPEFVTEHELNERENQRRSEEEAVEEGAVEEAAVEEVVVEEAASNGSKTSSKESKTTKCIKVRKLSGCAVM